MFLRKLSLVNFKNYRSAQLSLSKKINCFIGANGAGKTNLLDAIYYLCLTKSYFNPVDQQNILHGEIFFRVDGLFDRQKHQEYITCIQRQGKKKEFLVNKSPYSRLSEHIGEFPVVIVTPDDNSLIIGGSEERRRFMDLILSQLSHKYLDDLMSYNKIMTQRNSLLKQLAEENRWDAKLLDVYDKQLVGVGEQISEERIKMLKDFTPVFNEIYQWLSEGKEQVKLIYDTEVQPGKMGDLLKKAREKDRVLQRTTAGIHKDDLVFTIDGEYPVKKFGSQGQQKSFLLSLKLAQFQLIKEKKNLTPILLLDDIFDKLDLHRVKQVMKSIRSDRFGQIFLTDTDENRVREVFNNEMDEVDIFPVLDGEVVLT